MAKTKRKKLTVAERLKKHAPRPETLAKHIEKLESAAAKNKGILPSFSWLKAHGFVESYKFVMWYKPSAIKGMKREFEQPGTRAKKAKPKAKAKTKAKAKAKKASNRKPKAPKAPKPAETPQEVAA